ncbi:peptide MFS transporter [uncultured Sanguibacteroides sp.]|uniref:peptide MFS transporter n=1 Tax=uncultured Sanguibacteroides sp. TaxID=1635151 RepID=UPI0025F010D9|nr:peptide MFS transporter [uncultured Sanguibacteroides sp.]
MLKDHPRGLFVLAFANMGERFGYYTMLAIFTLYLQARYGWTSAATGQVFGGFLAAVYFLPVFGGFIADKYLGYGKTITLGTVIMFFGYALLAFGSGLASMFISLGLIALGTGFFKGNLQVLVGNLYDSPKYSKNRDLAFSIFYMCINIGAFFAPSMAEAITNSIMGKSGLEYSGKIPALAHQLIDGTINQASAGYTELVNFAASQGQTISSLDGLKAFAQNYIDVLCQSYNYGFGVACISLIVSLAIFLGFRKFYKSADATEKEKAQGKGAKDAVVIELTPKQTKERLIALGLVFAVVIFFWMSFHQNGLTMTLFARDYTVSHVTGYSSLLFSLYGLVPIILLFYGLFMVITGEKKVKPIGGIMSVVFILVLYFVYQTKFADVVTPITPQIFQQFNPMFIIILTPVFVGLFGWLNSKKKEPSAPRKIGIGMIIAALGFLVLLFGSFGLTAPADLQANPMSESDMVSPYWLINTYLVLTCAELFLSPMGISFVSKVAPPKYKGLMQGGWFAATAIGNYLVGIIGYFWEKVSLVALWGILIGCCAISAIFIFSIMGRLEKVTRESEEQLAAAEAAAKQKEN